MRKTILQKIEEMIPYDVKTGSYNVNRFYRLAETPLGNTFAPFTTAVSREEIVGAPRLDVVRWKDVFIALRVIPEFLKRFPQYHAPRIFLPTQKKDWYKLEEGTSLSDPSRFPEGAAFPEPIFQQMSSIFPALAELSEQKQLQPQTWDEHLQDMGFSMDKTKHGWPLRYYVTDQNGDKQEIRNEERDVIARYKAFVRSIQSPQGDRSKIYQQVNDILLASSELTREELHRWVDILARVSIWSHCFMEFPPYIYSVIGNHMFDPYSEYAQDEFNISPFILDLDQKAPKDGNTVDFAKNVLGNFFENVYDTHRDKYGPMFVNLCRDLGIPDRPLDCFKEAAEQLHERPFTFIHCDLHRKNLMVNEKNELIIMDWEMLNFGDPLYDANNHVMRIRYNPEQRKQFWQDWKKKMPEKYTRHAEKDLHVYEMFEVIKEVIVQLIRSTQLIAKGEITLADEFTPAGRNLQKLIQFLNQAGKDYWGWDAEKKVSFDSVYRMIEQAVKRTRNHEILVMRREGKQKRALQGGRVGGRVGVPLQKEKPPVQRNIAR